MMVGRLLARAARARTTGTTVAGTGSSVGPTAGVGTAHRAASTHRTAPGAGTGATAVGIAAVAAAHGARGQGVTVGTGVGASLHL